jgi:phenylpropionate dioxygenase-like ring-hydroxylating dioxygenase large terminal subunit
VPDDIRTPTSDAADKILATGLRNRWYCIGPSALAADKPVGLTRLGEKLVLWRDGEGKARVMQDRCPHRNAALSKGFVQNGLLTCGYHWLQIDQRGCVAAVPGSPSSALVGQPLVRTYPTVEHYQGIWTYFGDALHPDPVPLTMPEELTAPDWAGYVCSATWKANYLQVFDNVADPMHTPFLHAKTFTMAYGAKADEVVVADTPTGMRVTRKHDPMSNIEEAHFNDTGVLWFRVGVFYPKAAGPGGCLRIIATACPIDACSTQINFWRLRQTTGWQRNMWRFMFKMRLEQFAWEAIEEDREILESLAPWPPPAENLYQHDLGVARLRRLLRREAEAQAEALAGRT